MKPKLIKQLGTWWCTAGGCAGGCGPSPAAAYHAFKAREAVLRVNQFINQDYPFGGRGGAGFFDATRYAAQ